MAANPTDINRVGLTPKPNSDGSFWSVYPNGGKLLEGFMSEYVNKLFNDVSTRVVHPRPDTETETWAAHRLHYPGKEYYVPIEIFNMARPLVYELINGPTGATIGRKVGDPNYGAVKWSTPTAGTHSFTVRVYGQDYNRGTAPTDYIDVSWSLNCTTVDALHIDPVNGADTNNGILSVDGGTGPWKTTEPLFAAGEADATYSGKQVYLTDGTHNLYFDATAFYPGNGTFDGTNKPLVWKGQSQAGTILDFSTSQINWTNGVRDWFMDNLTCANSRPKQNQYMFYGFGEFHDGNNGGKRCTFSRVTMQNHRVSNVVNRDFLNTGRSGKYEWVLSPTGTNEYYLQAVGGGAPPLSNTFANLEHVGRYNYGFYENDFALGTIGSLANSEYAIGDPNSLGFDTIVLRYNDKSPSDSWTVDGNLLDIRYTSVGGENAAAVWTFRCPEGTRRNDWVFHKCQAEDFSEFELSDDVQYAGVQIALASLSQHDYVVENGTTYGPNYNAEGLLHDKSSCRYFTKAHVQAWNAFSPDFETRFNSVTGLYGLGHGYEPSLKPGWFEWWFTKIRSGKGNPAKIGYEEVNTTVGRGPVKVARCTIAIEDTNTAAVRFSNAEYFDDLQLLKNIFANDDEFGQSPNNGVYNDPVPSTLTANTYKIVPTADISAAFHADGSYDSTYGVDMTGYGADVGTEQ